MIAVAITEAPDTFGEPAVVSTELPLYAGRGLGRFVFACTDSETDPAIMLSFAALSAVNFEIGDVWFDIGFSLSRGVNSEIAVVVCTCGSVVLMTSRIDQSKASKENIVFGNILLYAYI